jgi:hypothetical protein
MKPIFYALIGMVVVSLFVAPALGQQNATNTTDYTDLSPAELQEIENCPEPETITEDLVLCEAEYDDGKAKLSFKADSLQRITLTDAGAFMKGGVVPQREEIIRSEGVNHIEWQVTTHKGFAGVSVATEQNLYAVPLEQSNTLVGGPWNEEDVQLAAISGAAGVGSVAVLVVIRAVLGRTNKPERIA